jgi:hypothetical protein
MKIVYTKHSEEKLLRPDIKKFKVTKTLIRSILQGKENGGITKYGELVKMGNLDEFHILRIIYVIIENQYKVITFYVARKGRYES